MLMRPVDLSVTIFSFNYSKVKCIFVINTFEKLPSKKPCVYKKKM